MTAQGILNSARNEIHVDTPTLHSKVVREFDLRAVFVGLTYSFGGGAKRRPDTGFEFDGPSGVPWMRARQRTQASPTLFRTCARNHSG